MRIPHLPSSRPPPGDYQARPGATRLLRGPRTGRSSSKKAETRLAAAGNVNGGNVVPNLAHLVFRVGIRVAQGVHLDLPPVWTGVQPARKIEHEALGVLPSIERGQPRRSDHAPERARAERWRRLSPGPQSVIGHTVPADRRGGEEFGLEDHRRDSAADRKGESRSDFRGGAGWLCALRQCTLQVSIKIPDDCCTYSGVN